MASYQIAGDHIAGEIVDGELIIVNLEQGTYFSSLGSGVRVWEALVSGVEMDDALPALGARAEDPAAFERAARGMIALLEDNQTIVVRPAAEPLDRHALLAGLDDTPLAPPAVETYVDMKDILMLDPIHDVGQAGWPARPEREGRNDWGH